MRGDWKVRGGQLIPGKGPEWMGIRRHEQDVSLPSKWGFLFAFKARGYAQIIVIVCYVNIKMEVFVCRLKINHERSTSS